MFLAHPEPDDSEELQSKLPASTRDYIVLGLKGVVLGASAILPGVSAGILLVIFGLFQVLIGFLAHPLRRFRSNVKIFLPVGFGWLVGFFLFARLIALFFGASELFASCLFAGVIMGTTPELFAQAGADGHKPRDLCVFAVTMALVYALLRFMDGLGQTHVEPNVFWYFGCGLLFGVSFVIPGLTFSSLFIFLGLYQPMNAGLAAMDPAVLLPMVLGTVLVTALLSRAIDRLFQHFRALCLHSVLGLTFASTLLIIPTAYEGLVQAGLCLLMFVIGFACVRLMTRLGLAG